MHYSLDRTFCASPNCLGLCGREFTPSHKAQAERVGKTNISFAYFCDDFGNVIKESPNEL